MILRTRAGASDEAMDEAATAPPVRQRGDGNESRL